MNRKHLTREGAVALLREHGVTPTKQRVEIVRTLFRRDEHLSAEQVFELVNTGQTRVSKATVYNTLGLFVQKGLIREVIADPTKTFYDPNTAPHHHFYDVGSGKLMDIDGDAVEVTGLPPLPEGARLEGVDVIVRVRNAD